jgi:hypothetical protein
MEREAAVHDHSPVRKSKPKPDIPPSKVRSHFQAMIG